jgi:hypothetical protein
MTSPLADNRHNAMDAIATASREIASQQMQQYQWEWMA